MNSHKNLKNKQQLETHGFAEKINYTLYDISNAVNTTRNLDKLYQSIYESLNKLIPLPNFYIAIYDNINKSINFEFFIDEYDNDFPMIENLKEPSSIIGEVLLTRRPLFLKENSLIERAKKYKLSGTPPKVWVGVPLVIQDKVFGVVCVQNYTDPDYFSHQHLEILISVSDQIAIAIERKQILNALEKKGKTYSESEEQAFSQDLLDHKNKTINNLIHDFNNLFSGIMGHLELLSIDQKNLSGNQKKSIENAFNSSQRAATLIRELQIIAKPDHHEPSKADLQAPEENLPQKTILVIEDEDMLREMVVNALKNYGYSALEACDGEIGIGIYKKNHHLIDAVLLDIIMPKISGIETFKQILAINPSAKIIIASGHVTNQDQRKMFAKAHAYLEKPYQIMELKEILQSILK